MKFTSAFLFACLGGAAAKSSIEVENTAYVGNDYGIKCEELGASKVADRFGKPLVYCFNVKNTGDTYLNKITITNVELNNYYDNSIGLLAPGASKMVTIQSELNKSLVNNVVVTASPAGEDGVLIEGSRKVMATKSSEVIETISQKISRNLRYASPMARNLYDSGGFGFDPVYASDGANFATDDCIQTKYEKINPGKSLICSEPKVYLQDLQSLNTMRCEKGNSMVSVNVDAEIVITEADSVYDLGWYIDTAGGDAMSFSKCVINGLQKGNPYSVLKPTVDESGGFVKWGATGGADTTSNGGFDRRLVDGADYPDMPGGTDDGDECGDVLLYGSGGRIPVPIIINTMVSCEDENDNGQLDFSICMTWHDGNHIDNNCKFKANVPANDTGGCYCHLYDVPNIAVVDPNTDGTAPC